MAVQGIDLVSDTTVKELVEQIKYGNALRAAEAADSLAGLRFPASPLPTGPVNQSNVAYPFLLCLHLL